MNSGKTFEANLRLSRKASKRVRGLVIRDGNELLAGKQLSLASNKPRTLVYT